MNFPITFANNANSTKSCSTTSAPHILYYGKVINLDRVIRALAYERNGNPTNERANEQNMHSFSCQIRRSADATHTMLCLSFVLLNRRRKKNIHTYCYWGKVYKDSLLEVAVAERCVRIRQSIYVWKPRWITTHFHIKGTILVSGCWFLRKCRFNVVHRNSKNQV